MIQIKSNILSLMRPTYKGKPRKADLAVSFGVAGGQNIALK